VDQVDRAGDVRVDDPARLVPLLIEEAMAEPPARVRKQRCHGPTNSRRAERVDALEGGQIQLQRLDRCTCCAQLHGGFVDLRLIRHDQQIEAVLCTALRQLEPDARRCARDDSEWS
jgi:hypothetical protein